MDHASEEEEVSDELDSEEEQQSQGEELGTDIAQASPTFESPSQVRTAEENDESQCTELAQELELTFA